MGSVPRDPHISLAGKLPSPHVRVLLRPNLPRPFPRALSAGCCGMGEVFRALDTRLSRNAVIKVLPASSQADHDLAPTSLTRSQNWGQAFDLSSGPTKPGPGLRTFFWGSPFFNFVTSQKNNSHQVGSCGLANDSAPPFSPVALREGRLVVCALLARNCGGWIG